MSGDIAILKPTPELPKPQEGAPTESVSGFKQGLLVFLLSLLVFGTLQILPGPVTNEDGSTYFGVRSRSLPLGDSPYHARLAYLYRTGKVAEAGHNFHWMSASIWSDGFADKEFLYHLYLIPFTLGAKDANDTTALIWGAKLSTAVLMSLIAMTLFGVLRGFNVRHAWAYVPLIVVLGGWVFCARAEETRAWPAGVICSLAGWLMMAKNRRFELGLVAAIFTLSYSAVHFLGILWAIRTVLMLVWGPERGLTRKREFVNNLWLLGSILAGVVLGILLHPGRADFLRMWVVTYLLVPAGILQGSMKDVAFELFATMGLSPGYSTEEASRMILGMEFLPLSGTMLLLGGAAAILCPMLLPLASLWVGHRPRREAVLAGAAAVLVLFMFLNSLRFAEIMGPFMALAAGIWLDDFLKSRKVARVEALRPVLVGRLKKAAFALSLVGLCVVMGGLMFMKAPNLPPALRDAALFLRDNPEAKGKVVYHTMWDMFPTLFFYAPDSDYIVGMDPNYLLGHDAEKSKLYWDVHYGNVDDKTLSQLRQVFRAEFIVVMPGVTPAFDKQCQDEIAKGNLKQVYKDPNYGVFVYQVAKR